MPIEATTPTELSASYNFWAFTFRTDGFGLASPGQDTAADPISATVTLVKYRVREDGVPEISPVRGDQTTITVPDIYALAAGDPVVADALNALVAAVDHIARSQGKL